MGITIPGTISPGDPHRLTSGLPLGDPSLPRYYHRGTGLVQHITGGGVWHRDRAKGRLKRMVKNAGGDPAEIEYCAGLGLRIRGVS